MITDNKCTLSFYSLLLPLFCLQHTKHFQRAATDKQSGQSSVLIFGVPGLLCYIYKHITDNSMFLANPPPTHPVTQHFALSDN